MLRIASNNLLSSTSSSSTKSNNYTPPFSLTNKHHNHYLNNFNHHHHFIFNNNRLKAERETFLLAKNNNSIAAGSIRRFDPNNVQKRVLEWCQSQTRSYKNVKITNFSSSWADGLAFCALIHSFMPDSFDFEKLSCVNRRQNFVLAFETAYKRANIIPLLEVSDMILMGNRPDDKCIYTYVSTIYSRFHTITPRIYQHIQNEPEQQHQ